MRRTVVIVEDDARLRAALAATVQAAPDLQLAGVAGDLPAAAALLHSTAPDVLLVDVCLPSGSGITLIRQAQRESPATECVVLTVLADDTTLMDSIAAGATGYLLKDASDADLVAQIRLLLDGGSPISPAIARRLLRLLAPAARAPGAAPCGPALGDGLTARERELLAMSAKGCSYAEIAELMGVSRHTVETHVKRIYRKLQVHTKTEAVYEARKLGWVRD